MSVGFLGIVGRKLSSEGVLWPPELNFFRLRIGPEFDSKFSMKFSRKVVGSGSELFFELFCDTFSKFLFCSASNCSTRVVNCAFLCMKLILVVIKVANFSWTCCKSEFIVFISA